MQDEIEWLEEKPEAFAANSVANTIINSDDIEIMQKCWGWMAVGRG